MADTEITDEDQKRAERFEAATVAMIHECRRLKCVPAKVGSAGQWEMIARAGVDAADAVFDGEAERLRAELERERTQNRLDDDLLRDIGIASRAMRSQSWPGDMADEMDRRSRRIDAFLAARAALSTQEESK